MIYPDGVEVHWMFNDVVVVGLFWKCCINGMKKQVWKTLHNDSDTLLLNISNQAKYKWLTPNKKAFNIDDHVSILQVCGELEQQ